MNRDRILKTPYITADAVVTKNGKILMVRRKGGAFHGYWALPGGFVKRGEVLRKAVAREVLEETGLKVVPEKMIGVYDDPKRDPLRRHVITVAFACKPMGGKPRPQPEEVSNVRFFPISEITKLKIAFDHRRIISDSVKTKKVLAGGTFNIIHPGHILFLEKAKSLGDHLTVVVASDKTVLRQKGLVMPAGARARVVASLKPVDKVVIGHQSDFFRVVLSERPDIIALGYDQKPDDVILQARKVGIKVVRIRSSDRRYKTQEILQNARNSRTRS